MSQVLKRDFTAIFEVKQILSQEILLTTFYLIKQYHSNLSITDRNLKYEKKLSKFLCLQTRFYGVTPFEKKPWLQIYFIFINLTFGSNFSPLESNYKEAFDGHTPQDVIFKLPRLLAVQTCLKEAKDGRGSKTAKPQRKCEI